MKIRYVMMGIIIGGLCLSGCVNTQTVADTEIEGKNKVHITEQSDEWEALQSALMNLRSIAYENVGYRECPIQHCGYNDEDINSTTSVGEDRFYIVINNVASTFGKEAIDIIRSYIGEEVDNLIAEAKSLSLGESNKILKKGEGQVVAKVVGNYGLVAEKSGDNILLYITHEPFDLTLKEDSSFMSHFKTEDFIYKAYSEGVQESVIEIATPIYKVTMDNDILEATTSYYQFFRNDKNQLQKVRMIINMWKNEPIRQLEFKPLENTLKYLGEDETLNTQIQEVVSDILSGKSHGKKLKGNNINCIIQQQSQLSDSEKLIIIEVEP